MILIFDDNQYRVKNLCKAFRNAELPVMGVNYDNWEYYTKPMVTIMINPNPREIEYISSTMRRQNTISVFVLKKDVPEKRHAKHVIINPDATITPEQIKEIIKAEHGYNFYDDCIKYIFVCDEYKDVYFGGKRLWLEKREYPIVRFFVYNQNKIFTIDDILCYLNLRIKPNSFSSYVSTINGKCLDMLREDIILRHNFGYGVTPVTGIIPVPKKTKTKI